MSNFRIFETEKAGKIGDKIVNATQPCPGSMEQRQLADISNLPRKARPKIQVEKSQPVQITIKEHIEHLQKVNCAIYGLNDFKIVGVYVSFNLPFVIQENLALKKMLVQRNEIIEKSGIELEMLRGNMLKLQEQNQHLALSNAQILEELNSYKDRSRLLQHELGCKTGVLKALKLELEEKEKTNRCRNAGTEVKLRKFLEEGESSKEGEEYEQPHSPKRRLLLNNSASSEHVHCDGKAETKRIIVRRQSTRFKKAESKPTENLNKEDDTKFLKCVSSDNQAIEDALTIVNESLKHEDKECYSDLRDASQELERPYQCRPSRVAARKVQSYKEIPLNVKMRRTD
ncbi:shugoshin-1 [Dorcoceras hygrometricum]|uniref:Shugoshin-1 n=1 Tax=Dorcoceras hygrometricum TaxID=472368 RepID=A0A2Z7C7U4_9LAMI|nr:shugoshin-1 [Dorcoceras hygrometricum]